MARLLLPIVAALTVVTAGALAVWTFAIANDPAGAEVRVVRWGNLTVQVSDDSGVFAAQDYARALTGERQPVLVLMKGDSFVEIDAETGRVMEEDIADADRGAIEEVQATLEVAQQDIATAPWPYSGDPPAVPRKRIGNITYIPPDPASGIDVKMGIADSFDERGSEEFILITTSRSSMNVSAETGLLGPSRFDYVAADDLEAFQRFLSEVELVTASGG